MWGARYPRLGRVERPNKPLQSHPEVKKKWEPVPGRMKGGGGDMEEIPALLEAPPEEERRRRREREKRATPASPFLPPSRLPQCSHWLNSVVNLPASLSPGKHSLWG